MREESSHYRLGLKELLSFHRYQIESYLIIGLTPCT